MRNDLSFVLIHIFDSKCSLTSKVFQILSNQNDSLSIYRRKHDKKKVKKIK